MYLYAGSHPAFIWRIRAQRDKHTCKLIFIKILNIGKGDEIIKKVHCLLTRSKEKSCLSYASDDNRVIAMYEYSTTINCVPLFAGGRV